MKIRFLPPKFRGGLSAHDSSRTACAADHRSLEAISRGRDPRCTQGRETTLASLIAPSVSDRKTRFDLKDPADLARLADPMLTLRGLTGLIVLDQVQRRPELARIG